VTLIYVDNLSYLNSAAHYQCFAHVRIINISSRSGNYVYYQLQCRGSDFFSDSCICEEHYLTGICNGVVCFLLSRGRIYERNLNGLRPLNVCFHASKVFVLYLFSYFTALVHEKIQRTLHFVYSCNYSVRKLLS
jgi:hypothetical protein